MLSPLEALLPKTSNYSESSLQVKHVTSLPLIACRRLSSWTWLRSISMSSVSSCPRPSLGVTNSAAPAKTTHFRFFFNSGFCWEGKQDYTFAGILVFPFACGIVGVPADLPCYLAVQLHLDFGRSHRPDHAGSLELLAAKKGIKKTQKRQKSTYHSLIFRAIFSCSRLSKRSFSAGLIIA